MERLFSKIIKREDVLFLAQEIIYNNRYKNISIPLTITNNYSFFDHYALFLLFDSILKFDFLIGEERYIEDYLSQLKRLFKRIDNYQDINKGVIKILVHYIVRILNLSNTKDVENKEGILRYIYEKYIVDGYFYYGFSSCHKKEVDFSGIKKAGYILDSRIDDVNSILKKYEGRDIIYRVESDISDNFIISSYFSMIGPDYLEKLANSKIFDKDLYDKRCFYTKDSTSILHNFEIYAKERHLLDEEKNVIFRNMKNILEEERVADSFGVIAFIKRSALNRNYLKDIEEIICGAGEVEVESSVAMIMESRYSCYDIDQDISPLDFDFLELPNYNYFCGNEEDFIVRDNCFLSDARSSSLSKIEETTFINKKQKFVNSYGFISIFMVGLLLIVVIGTTMIILNGR